MLRIVTGPFHPDLERALTEEIRRLKETDPLAPFAIVVPSKLLLDRLRRLLVLDAKLPLLNVHFLTFHQLALRLYEEGRGQSAPPDKMPEVHAPLPPAPMLLVEDLFFEQLLRQLVRRPLPGVELLRQFGQTAGTWSALWATVRDLKDAAVDPAVALRAVGEGLFDPEDTPKLQALITLYAAVLESKRVLGVGSADDVAVAATPLASTSRFLSRLQGLCYYGFYDLTQVQLSLFEAVAAKASVTLYFPLSERSDRAAWGFARRFYERHVLPLGPQPVPAGPGTVQEPPQVRVISVVGADDELAVCCKEILSLVETNGYRYDDIGVVARTLDPYQASLRRLFDRHRIPFTSTATVPIVQEPVIKTLLQLASLPVTGLYQASVLEVLAAPHYKIERMERQEAEPRPDLWRLAVRVLGITRGEEEWRRLEAAGQQDLWVGDREETEAARTERGGHVAIEAAQLRLLWRLVSELAADCRALPERGGSAELTDAFVSFASRRLAVPGLGSDWREEDEPSDRFRRLGTALRNLIEQLRLLDRIGAEISWQEWAATFTRAVERARVPVADGNYPGVPVLDAMAARGLPFRALFLLGFNEKVFPRFIREDAFLRDRHRRVLEETLGYKIDEKLAGYDEEQLLFAMLSQAATQRLYLLYQRADAEGRPLVPSPYLDQAVIRPAGGEVTLVPRRFSERVGTTPFLQTLLTREELALWLVLQGHDPAALQALWDRPERLLLFQNGGDALRLLEGEAGQPGPLDGVTGPLERYWTSVVGRGVAPTPLERYARCPFQYFAAQVLKLEPLRQPVLEELQAQTMGELCHALLRVCYPRLVEAGWPEREPAVSVQDCVRRAADEVFTAHEAKQGTGYALIWDLARETVEALVLDLLEIDGEECRVSGFRPVAFEVEAQGRLEGLPEALRKPETVTVKGWLDRVDRRENPPALRIVDYKYKQSQQITGEDRNLPTAAVRAFRLQPPLYALMKPRAPVREPGRDGQAAPPVESVEFLFLAPHWENRVERASFDAATWQGPAGPQIKQTLAALLGGIKEGQFHILPDGYCAHCDFSTACRRYHGPTWWRAYRAPSAQRLRLLRKQKTAKTATSDG